ncbi:hypothetical protein ACFWY9_26735 [Amycolatopsis sp. NPDC059027]|uniref:hypothetical protein n=1 Tax=unclassified Amycolatopsis TaxID=2618356 RepID=UPI00366EA81A
MPERLDPVLRDEIDDRVAEAFDAYLAERLAEPGPLRSALDAGRGAGVVLGTVAFGAFATVVAQFEPTVLCWIWGSLAVVNLAWLLTRPRR